MLHGVRPLGVLVALDRFGTGALPLTQIARLAVDRIKIDRRFVTNLETDAGDRGVVAAAVALARAAGHPAVAMGVERQGQLATLRALGCDEAQGFLLGPPAEATSLAALLDGARGMGTLPYD